MNHIFENLIFSCFSDLLFSCGLRLSCDWLVQDSLDTIHKYTIYNLQISPEICPLQEPFFHIDIAVILKFAVESQSNFFHVIRSHVLVV